MSECANCHAEHSDVEMRLGRMSCLKCAQDRYSRALSNYIVATSTEVIATPDGWRTALCVDREPVEWLCPHLHRTSEEAHTCLAETLAAGGGRFPIR